jgi:hypothetical protein
MACSRCGAPLEFANGQPTTCRFCGNVEHPPEPPRQSFAGHGNSAPQFIVIQGPADDDDDEESFPSYAAPEPPPYVPSASGSVVGKIVMVAAIVLGAGVVLSIMASSDSGDRHPATHQHHHRR